MHEIYEFRVLEEHAGRLFAPDEGTRLSSTVRKIMLRANDPRLPLVGELQKSICKETPGFFFSYGAIHRRYTKKELENAELFQLKITAAFEPIGEECGTEYIEGSGCPECGSGKEQKGPLRLDLRKVPKNKDLARTIAHEWIVSQRLGELLIDAGLSGFELRRVLHKGHYEDDPYYLSETPTGRKILELAKEADVVVDTWPYYVWLNRPELGPLVEQSKKEMAVRKRKGAKRRGIPDPIWYQLVPIARPVEVVSPTKTGNEPFDEDPNNEYRCSRGDLIGLNLLSELWLKRSSYDGSDVAITRQFVGKANSWILTPLLLISPKFCRLLETEKVKGYKVEVAHLV